MVFEPYDLEIHRDDVQLYELIVQEVDGVLETSYSAVDIDPETAAQMPWHYVVEIERD
jgi:hypothetical protein